MSNSKLQDKGVLECRISNTEGTITKGIAGTNSTSLMGPQVNVITNAEGTITVKSLAHDP